MGRELFGGPGRKTDQLRTWDGRHRTDLGSDSAPSRATQRLSTPHSSPRKMEEDFIPLETTHAPALSSMKATAGPSPSPSSDPRRASAAPSTPLSTVSTVYSSPSQSPSTAPPQPQPLAYPFEASIHVSDQPHHGFHGGFTFTNRTRVSVDTKGRAHSGTLFLSFVDPEGTPCTADKWVASNPNPAIPSNGVEASGRLKAVAHDSGEQYSCAVQVSGLTARLETKGRKHEAKVKIEKVPENREIVRPFWCQCEDRRVGA